MIELKNLTTGYGEHIVARSINSIIPEGNLISLLGPNGVGKSTLLRTLCAFQPAISGDIIINGNKTNEYTFQMDYYWMQGDNRHCSADSRYWGFVPEEHIVGKPIFIWLSTDADRAWFSGHHIRWNRLFSLVDNIK